MTEATMAVLASARAVYGLLSGVGLLVAAVVLGFGHAWSSIGFGIAGIVAAQVAMLALAMTMPDEGPAATIATTSVAAALAVGSVLFFERREPLHAFAAGFWAYGPATAWIASRPTMRLLTTKASVVAPACAAHLAWVVAFVVAVARA